MGTSRRRPRPSWPTEAVLDISPGKLRGMLVMLVRVMALALLLMPVAMRSRISGLTPWPSEGDGGMSASCNGVICMPILTGLMSFALKG